MLPARSNTTACARTSCSSATARRIARTTASTSSGDRPLYAHAPCRDRAFVPFMQSPIWIARLHFGGDDQAFFVCNLNRKRRATSRPHRRMALFHRQFDFLRIEIAAVDDDQILQAAGDEQLAVSKKSQIAGAEKRPFAGICQVGMEGELGFLGPIPIALRDARARTPKFHRLVRRAGSQRFRIDDDDSACRASHGRIQPACATFRRRSAVSTMRLCSSAATWVVQRIGSSLHAVRPKQSVSLRQVRNMDRRSAGGNHRMQRSRQTVSECPHGPARRRCTPHSNC